VVARHDVEGLFGGGGDPGSNTGGGGGGGGGGGAGSNPGGISTGEVRHAEEALDRCTTLVTELQAARISDEKRFKAAGITFDYEELRHAREAAVAMTGRCLERALRCSQATRRQQAFVDTVDAATAAAEAVAREGAAAPEVTMTTTAAETGTLAAAAAAGPGMAGVPGPGAAGAGAGTAAAASRASRARWQMASAPPGARELKVLRAACDLAYRAYSGCGGVSARVEALALQARAEIHEYGDDTWRAADAIVK
jgi:hypothetical protein